ncbi:MAG: hypothetical protein IPP49_19575 [Saprospiraceae bacterium]|nr:hypothetical protein [Saprospiraceae bacterium]
MSKESKIQISSVVYCILALNYIRSSWSAPKANASLAYEKAKLMTTKTVKAVTDFMQNDWKTYQQKVKNMDVKIFNE